MIYAWHRPRSVDAQLVGEVVVGLTEQHGGVCPPAALVGIARPSSSPLHGLFQWDDAVAAEAYRRDQARSHIRELRLVEVADGEQVHLQAFVHVVRNSEHGPVEGYRLTRLVVLEAGEYEQVLDEALAGLRAWQRRYAHLTELGDVFRAIGTVV